MIKNKKWLKKIIIPLSFVFACAICFAVVFVFQLRSISASHIESSREHFSVNYENLGNCYVDEVLFENNFIHQEQTKINKEGLSSLVDDVLTKLPECVKTCVLENWAIVFAQEIPEFVNQYVTNLDTSSISAVTVPHIKTVFVFTTVPDSVLYVLPHELGHVLADEYGAMDYDPEFHSLYALYKDSYEEDSAQAISGYATSTPYEFFAATMSEFLMTPESLYSDAPEIAEYMAELLKEAPYNSSWDSFWLDVKEIIRKEKRRAI